MKERLHSLTRLAYAVVSLALVTTITLPGLVQEASAAQVTSRSIEMSSSNPGQASTKYTVSFTTATTSVVQGVVVDFCTESPILGGTCTAPTGMVLTSLGVTSPVTGLSPTTGWAATTPTGDTHAAEVYNASGASINSSTAVSFELTGITNPTTTGSFYARILTFATKAGADAYTSSTPGTHVDDGGIALSTASQITVTATVMEQLSFCTSKAAPGQAGTDCAGATTPSITLGHGTPTHLDSTAVDTGTAYTQVSTNAQTGVTVRMTDNNTCTNGGLASGTNCIPGIGTFGTMTAGTADYGLNVGNGTGGTGTVTANANYGTTAGSYGMGTNVTSVYGDPIEASSGPVSEVNSLLTFAATASNTTKAGVYAANMTLVATGTF